MVVLKTGNISFLTFVSFLMTVWDRLGSRISMYILKSASQLKKKKRRLLESIGTDANLTVLMANEECPGFPQWE